MVFGTTAAVGDSSVLDDFSATVTHDPLGNGYRPRWKTSESQFVMTPLGMIPTITFAPSGAPGEVPSGHACARFNTTDNKLYIWNGVAAAWKAVTLT
jgi:hypothetical protein